MTYWLKLIYDRNTYIIDLDQVGAFCHTPNGRISFVVMDGNTTIVINQQSDPTSYQAVLDYVKNKTGMSLN
ncbi:hypothetical protein OsccyDRAFT_1270 [Leptolyngbyaceae cyanobacterium JSC-12]|nr:hypothetical protein OsccyDRAFT_1270 [Leptolyngbyaceae cyanobacterium JSC-12]